MLLLASGRNGEFEHQFRHIVPGPAEPHFSKLLDIHMMCWGNGRERTEQEYTSLLGVSGWRFVTCHYPSAGAVGVVEGITV